MSQSRIIQVPGHGLETSLLQPTPEDVQALLEAERAAHAKTKRQLEVMTTAAHAAGAQLAVTEPITERGAEAIAASAHRHLTSDECLRAGVSKVVLAKDGWYVPPELRVY